MIVWDEIMSNPDAVVTMDRATLWAIWNCLLSTDFDKRDEFWNHASDQVRQLLSSSFSPSPTGSPI